MKVLVTDWNDLDEDAMIARLMQMRKLKKLCLSLDKNFHDVEKVARAIQPTCIKLRRVDVRVVFRRKDLDDYIRKILDMRLT